MANPPESLENKPSANLRVVAEEWLKYESAGARLRLAHRFAEWDGWEEGLADTILGAQEHEQDWFAPEPGSGDGAATGGGLAGGLVPAERIERAKLRVLDTTGDVCGGRGGELGRRLEAWLSEKGDDADTDADEEDASEEVDVAHE